MAVRQPSGTVANVASDDVDEGLTDALSKEVFASYTCRSLAHIQGQPHPGDIAEPASLAAIPLPTSTYPLAFPPEILSSGKLSALQIEGILHACTKHLSFLPSGERAGFFIGDGAGVGKGRQIAGIILDSYFRGRSKSAWITTSTDLHADAVRDLRDLGSHVRVHNNLQSLDRATVTPSEGVMFVTYATLTSVVRGRSRLAQLVQWLGGIEFDGVLVFDEAHKSKHYSAKEGQGTKVATAVVDLQKALPRARVVYCSATGVSEVGNMAYMSRLGLFGGGTAFSTFDSFLNSLKRKGISFLEMLAMELKGDGFYVARGLSFRSAEFLDLEVALTSEQETMYDEAVAAWGALRTALHAALLLCGEGTKDPWRSFWSAQQRFFKLLCVSIKVPAVVKEAQAALTAGHAAIIGLQSTGEAAADAIALQPGDSCGWISVTKELMLQFVANHFPVLLQGQSRSGGGVQPQQQQAPPEHVPAAQKLRDAMMERIESLALPPNFLDDLIDRLGGKHAVAEMTGRKARVVRGVNNRPMYELRAAPDSSEMDSLNIREKEAFMAGKKLVAIISDAASTGISLHADGRAGNQRRRVHLTIELPWSADKAIQQLGRSHRSNQTSAPLYKIVFTDLGGEKRFAAAVARRLQSLGALTRGDRRAASGLDLGSMNFDSPAGRRALRRMYDAFVEKSPLLPLGVKLEDLMAGLPPEDAHEFAPRAPINNGDRITAADVVEAVLKLHETLRTYVNSMGIGIDLPRNDTVAENELGPSAASKAGASELGDVRRFLNRLLAVPVRRQRLLFNYFQATLTAEIAASRAAGTYAEGVSDLPGQTIARIGEPQVLWADPITGQTTLRHDLSIDRGVSLEAARDRLERERRADDASGFYRSRRSMPGSGRHGVLLALQKPGSNGLFSIIRPNTGPSFIDMDIEELGSKYTAIKMATEGGVAGDSASWETFKVEWEEWYEGSLLRCTHGAACVVGTECHVGKRLMRVSVLSGSIVRIWDCLERVIRKHEAELSKADRVMRIVRVDTMGLSAGLPLIGLRYPGHLLGEVTATLTAETVGMGRIAHAKNISGSHMAEDPLPVDPRAFKRAFTAPITVLDFFKPRPAALMAPPIPKRSKLDQKDESGIMEIDLEEERTSSPGEDAGEAGERTMKGYIEPIGALQGNEDDIASLVGLGFSQAHAAKALQVTGNIERAANWLLARYE